MKYPISNQSETKKIFEQQTEGLEKILIEKITEQQTEELEKVLIEKIKRLPGKLHEIGEHDLAFMLENWDFKDVIAFVNFFKDTGYSIELEKQEISKNFKVDSYKLTQDFKIVICKGTARLLRI